MRLDVLEEVKMWIQSVDTQYDIENFLFKGIKAWLCMEEFTPGDSLVHLKLYNSFRTQKIYRLGGVAVWIY